MLDNWDITLGRIVAPFGLRGEVKVVTNPEAGERLQSVKQICLRPVGRSARNADEPRLVRVTGARPHKGQILLRLHGVDSIEAAEGLRGALVQVRREDEGPLPEGAFYARDLVGMEVVTASGRPLGPVEEVLAYPAQDLLRIGDALVPMVRDIVKEIDSGGRRIVIDPPEGLLPGETAAEA